MKDEEIPKWDWTVYQPYPEDEQLNKMELFKKISTDIIYFCKYELRFKPFEWSEEVYKERVEKLEKKGFTEKNNEGNNSFYPPYFTGQADFLRAAVNPDIRYCITAAGRRGGKTHAITGIATFLPFTMFSFKNPPIEKRNIVIFAHRKDHVEKVILSNIKDRIANSPNLKKYVTKSNSEEIEFMNNVRITATPVSDPDRIRGKTNVLAFISDESKWVKREVFNIIRPIINETPIVQLKDGTIIRYKTKLIAISTPEGFNNWFARMWFDCRNKAERGFSDRIALRWHSLDNPYYDPQEVIDDLVLDELFWRQEYGAEFLTTSGSFFTPDVHEKCVQAYQQRTIRPNYTYYYGIDWGASSDSTVIFVLEDLGNRLNYAYHKEFIKTEYNEQIAFIVRLARRIPPAVIKADRAGRAQNTILAYEYNLPLYPAEGQYMGQEWKTMAFNNTKRLMQAGKVGLPVIPKLKEQLLGLSVSRTSGGYLSFSDKKVGHDDYVDALVLAINCKNFFGGYEPSIRVNSLSPVTHAKRDAEVSSYQPKFYRYK